MSPQTDVLHRKLGAAVGRWRSLRLLQGVLWALVTLVILSVACFHFDRLWPLSSQARSYWRMAIPGGGLLTFAGFALAAVATRLSASAVAAAVERRHPVFRERLLTTLDLVPAAAASGPAANYSPALVRSIADETRQVAADLDFRQAIDTRSLRVSAAAAAAAILLLCIQVAAARAAFFNWVDRMQRPNADIPPFASTLVQVLPDRSVAAVGDSATILVKTWGDVASRAVLHLGTESGQSVAWMSVSLSRPVTPAGGSQPDARLFRFRLPRLSSSLSLYASANDGRSNEKEIAVFPRPALLSLTLRTRYPAYMRRADSVETSTGGSFAAPRGAQIEVTGASTSPLSKCMLASKTGAAEWGVNGASFRGSVSVWKDASYRLQLVDRHGFASAQPASFSVHAERDQPPAVQIFRPAADLDLTPQGSLPLIARAVDDYGVQSMSLVYEKTLHDESQVGAAQVKQVGRGALGLPGPTGAPRADVAQRWHIQSVGASPGETIHYEVDALDNDAIDGPQRGRSMAFNIHVVSVSEMQQRLKTALDEEQRALSLLRQQQAQALRHLRSAASQKNRLQSAQAAEQAAAQEAASLADRVNQLSEQLQDNGMATPSTLARRDEAGAILRKDGSQRMPDAANRIQQGASLKASRARQEAQNAESGVAQDLARAQKLLGRTPDSAQLASKAAALAKQQQQLAEASDALGEDLRAQKQQHAPMAAEDRAGMQMDRQRQSALSSATRQLQQELHQAAQDAQQRNDQSAARALQNAAQALKQGDAAGSQQRAQQNLKQNNPAGASPHQQAAAQALQRAADAAKQAAGQPQSASKDPAQQLQKAAQNLQALAEQQQQLADKIGHHSSSSRSMANQQGALQNQAAQAQQQLGASSQAQQSVQNAQQNMAQSQQQLGQNQPESARQPAQDAAKELQNAAQQARKSAEQLQQEKAARELADKVERLALIQQGLQTETKRLDREKQNLDSNRMRERREVGERQQGIETQATDMTSQFPSPAFRKAMQMAAGQMHAATQNLQQDEPDTGKETQKAQGQAARTLGAIARALKQQAQSGSQQQSAGQQGGQGQSGSPQQDETAEALGELMLAQGLQQELRSDTGSLDSQRQKPSGAMNKSQQQEEQRLTQGQKQTQEITRRASRQMQGGSPPADEAARQMQSAEERLAQEDTGSPTQGHQDEALRSLAQAIQQAQQKLQQQQQQQQQQQAGSQGAPMPMMRPGSQPLMGPFSKLVQAQRGRTSAPFSQLGKGFAPLSPRAQRSLNQGRSERVPAEYQDLVARYYKSLAEKGK